MKLRNLVEAVKELLNDENEVLAEEILDTEITALVSDSRVKIEKGNAFVCIEGTKTDGHTFAAEAEKNGAAVIFAQKKVELTGSARLVLVNDSRKAISLLSAAWFDYPAQKLKTIGITGTKGKSTTCYMISNILKAAGHKVGIIGTIGVSVGDKMYDTNNTTPDPYLIQKYIREMVDNGCDTMVMEVSSQGLKQDRVYGIEYDYAALTNIGHDHIGGLEHKDFEEYLYCKSLLFRQCKTAVVNAQDEHLEDIISGAACRLEGFASSPEFDHGRVLFTSVFTAENICLYSANAETGVMFNYNSYPETVKGTVKLLIPGRFNVMNAMCAIAVCRHFNVDEQAIADGLMNTFVLGRLEPVKISDRFTILIDYAHNAMALESVLKTLREYKPKRLVCLFGCGGDRSKDRRFEMGEVSSKMADLTVVTSDNPRTEKPEDIIADIMTGVKRADGEYIMIVDRREAIRYVIENAQQGDVILLAGKGNETYQEINGVKHHMDEREIIHDVVEALGGKV